MLLQKTISTGASQIKNDGIMERYLYTGTHDAIISDKLFLAVQLKREGHHRRSFPGCIIDNVRCKRMRLKQRKAK